MPIFEGDRPLLDAFKRGEKAALDRVYDHYFRAIATIVRWGFSTNSGARIEGIRDLHREHDLIHDIFVRAFGDAARLGYDGMRPYKPYLMQIARNLLIDGARRSGREIIAAAEQEPGANPVSSVDLTADLMGAEPWHVDKAEDHIDWQRLLEATRDYLARLDPEIRALVQQRYKDGLPQQKVAQELGVSRARVRKLERIAMSGLRKHLKSLGLVEILETR